MARASTDRIIPGRRNESSRWQITGHGRRQERRNRRPGTGNRQPATGIAPRQRHRSSAGEAGGRDLALGRTPAERSWWSPRRRATGPCGNRWRSELRRGSSRREPGRFRAQGEHRGERGARNGLLARPGRAVSMGVRRPDSAHSGSDGAGRHPGSLGTYGTVEGRRLTFAVDPGSHCPLPVARCLCPVSCYRRLKNRRQETGNGQQATGNGRRGRPGRLNDVAGGASSSGAPGACGRCPPLSRRGRRCRPCA